MKYSLLFAIELYWLFVPRHERRKCLFKRTCSNYVYEKTKKEGLLVGIKALLFRIKNCNPNFSILEIDGKKLLVSANNKTFPEDEINQSILNS